LQSEKEELLIEVDGKDKEDLMKIDITPQEQFEFPEIPSKELDVNIKFA
jgi:hypothetical protein